MNKKIYKFEEAIKNIGEFGLGTKIRSERGDVYNLSQAEGKGNQRKFSRWNGTKLRFMTYENIGKKFEILEDNTEEIEEIGEFVDLIGMNENEEELFKMIRCCTHKIDELVRAVNKMKEGKE